MAEHAPGETGLAWWQREVFYQIYPRSFQDSNGDGNGDLRGIRARLDYVQWLGAGAIWICPFFRSPMADGGYDISDYCDVDPLFGNMDDFTALLDAVHARGMKLVLDLVPNHTSDQHPWFIESRSSRDNPRRDWYVWRDAGPENGAPSNWLSHFGGCAWRLDQATGQYYYHAFLSAQPDLNWRNPELRRAIYDVMRFWLTRGVDGFRVDAVTNLVEDDLLRDDPQNRDYRRGMPPDSVLRRVFTKDRPETHQIVGEMRDVLDEFPDRVLIGEVHLPLARAMAYYGRQRPFFNLPFNFQLMQSDWDCRSLSAAIDQYTQLLPQNAWPNWVLGNHDEKRLATRIGKEQARIAAMLLMTLKGTPFIYNGDELGMRNVPISRFSMRDTRVKTMSHRFSRDGARTPMRWNSGKGSGFTTSTKPWLPLGNKTNPADVASQQEDGGSLLNLYRDLIALRRKSPALIGGAFVPLATRGDVLGYERHESGQRFRMALNMGPREQRFPFDEQFRVVISTVRDRNGERVSGDLLLRPHEGLIAEAD
jgi:alpha-glucosidase